MVWIATFFAHGGYWFLVPLAVLEGPLLAILCGVGASFGYLDPFIAWGILVAGDFFPDMTYYTLGRWGATMPRVRAFATRSKIIRENLPSLEALWRENFVLALVFTKLAYGISPPLIVSIGLSGIPLRRFALWSLAIATVYLGALVGIGFGITQAFGFAHGIIGNAAIYFGVVGCVCIALFAEIAYWARTHLPRRGTPRSNIINR